MIKRMLAVDGVNAICQFRDDGSFVDGYGLLPEEHMVGLAKFAHDYKRIVQGNADQLSMFTQMNGWTPPGGWIVRGRAMSVCSIGNLVCLVENAEGSLKEVMTELKDVSSM
jgi:roadblock/LC7 domain-containing protein